MGQSLPKCQEQTVRLGISITKSEQKGTSVSVSCLTASIAERQCHDSVDVRLSQAVL